MTQPRLLPLNERSSRWFLRDDRGLSTVEYVVILVLIAIAAISTWRAFGGTIMAKIDSSNIAIRDMEGNGSGPGQGPNQSGANPTNPGQSDPTQSNPSQSNPSSNTNTPSKSAAQTVTPSEAPAKQAKGKIAD